MPMSLSTLSQQLVNDRSVVRLVQIALNEDLGTGDITTELTIDESVQASAVFVAKAPGIVSGLDVAEIVLRSVGENIEWKPEMQDGDSCSKGSILATMHGSAHYLLSAERTALNFLQRMCGVATKARAFVDAVKHTKTQILDTRKTIPGWRVLDKYAAHCGGVVNNRMGLFDMVLIKDNHIAAAGSLRAALEAVRELYEENRMTIEIECDTLDQVREALSIGGFHRIMFDNFSLDAIREGVALVGDRFKTEASGGITVENVSSFAECGVDYISTGAVTHSAIALDISMDIQLHS